MPTPAFKPLRYRGFAWLFWLAMLLPMAQSAAAWHGYSHAPVDASTHEGDKQAPHAAHCDLCLSAAALGGGALTGKPPGLVTLTARHALPPSAAGSVWLALAPRAYRSRAPPPSAH